MNASSDSIFYIGNVESQQFHSFVELSSLSKWRLFRAYFGVVNLENSVDIVEVYGFLLWILTSLYRWSEKQDIWKFKKITGVIKENSLDFK